MIPNVVQIITDEEMDPTRSLIHEDYLGGNFEVTEGDVHVLVVFPFSTQLLCVVVNDGTSFPVRIDEHDKWWQLKEKVQEKVKYELGAHALKLYLAKNQGKWLTWNSDYVKDLRRGVIPDVVHVIMNEDEINPMIPLMGESCLGTRFAAALDDVHLLVSFPAASHKSPMGVISDSRLTLDNHVHLVCAVVGGGKIFRLSIDVNASLGHLKEKIKDMIQYQSAAKELTLFLAKENDNTWLNVEILRSGVLSDVIRAIISRGEMESTDWIKDDYARVALGSQDDIHVLVVVPHIQSNQVKKNENAIWRVDGFTVWKFGGEEST